MGQPTSAERQRALRAQAGRGARDRRGMSWKPTTDPVVITCALTGGIHGKEANEALPEQPDEIVEQGIDAWRAGAAVLHVHARNPDGSNTMDAEIYSELHERLCAETDAVVQLTTGGSPRLSVEERITTVRLAPEMCSLNMGLLNFFIRGEQVFFPNHRDDIERFAREIRDARRAARARGLQPARCSRRSSICCRWRSSSRRTRSTSCCTRRRRAAQRGTPRNLVDGVERLRDLSGRPGRPARDGHEHGPDAAAADHDRDRDGAQRARRDGGQRPLPPRRAGGRTTRSSSSGRCGSPTSSTAGRRRRTRRASCSRCAGGSRELRRPRREGRRDDRLGVGRGAVEDLQRGDDDGESNCVPALARSSATAASRGSAAR